MKFFQSTKNLGVGLVMDAMGEQQVDSFTTRSLGTKGAELLKESARWN